MARDGGTSELLHTQAFRDFIPARASVRPPSSSFHFVPKLLLNAAYHQLPQELLPQPPSDVLCPALAGWTLTTRSQGQYGNRTRHSRVLVRTLDAVEHTPVLRICAVHGGVLSKKHKSRT